MVEYFTRHNQVAIVTNNLDENYAEGYIIGDSGKKYPAWWYRTKNKDMPYVREADYPSGEDLSPDKSSEEWSGKNAKERLN